MELKLESREPLIEEWRKQDPLLVDADKMMEFIDRRLEAQEMLRLIRLCHPNEHGEAITRSEVIEKIGAQGLKILDDLGWPRDMESYYKFIHTGDICTLADALWDLSDDLDPWRTAMHDYEDEIVELTNRDFLCLEPQEETEEKKVRCAGRGLECTA